MPPSCVRSENSHLDCCSTKSLKKVFLLDYQLEENIFYTFNNIDSNFTAFYTNELINI